MSDDGVTTASPAELKFFGSHERALDSAGRFAVPFRTRKDVAKEEEFPRFFVYEDPDGVICLLTYEQYERSTELVMEMEEGDERDDFFRWLADHSEEVPVDKQRRVTLPKTYIKLLGLDGRIRMRGMINRIELSRPVEAGEAAAPTRVPPRKYAKRFLK